MLLAIDAGLRCGLAWYGLDGRLIRYRSTHFTDRGSLRRAAYGLHGASLIYAEGGGPVADPWLKAAAEDRRSARGRSGSDRL